MPAVPQDNQLRWEWIKYQLHARGSSFAELARIDEVTKNTILHAKHVSCPRIEHMLADALELAVWELWPDRHAMPDEVAPGVAGFPARLRQIAERHGGQNEFARVSGLSRKAISNYLSGATYPTLDRIEPLARALGVSAMWLVFGPATAA